MEMLICTYTKTLHKNHGGARNNPQITATMLQVRKQKTQLPSDTSQLALRILGRTDTNIGPSSRIFQNYNCPSMTPSWQLRGKITTIQK